MGRPRARAEGEPDTAARILAAAEIAFSQHGFEAARLGDIAKEAGIRRPSLLYHFPSKHELYCAVVEGTFAAMGAAIAAPLEARDLPFPKRVEALFDAFGVFLASRPAAARIVLREVMDDRGPGQAILLNTAVPLLERVEAFLHSEGSGSLREGLPLRTALLSIVVSGFVRNAAEEPLASALFADPEETSRFLRVAFFRASEA